MEFDYQITKLQGALYSLGKRGCLDSDDLIEIGKTLKEIFEDVNDDEVKLKMLFFMILNTDCSASPLLRSDENIGLFVCLSNQLKVNQTVEMIWEIGLHSQFNEIIENCNSAITKDFISYVISNAKFWKWDDNSKHSFSFWRSLFYKIHYISKGHQEDSGIVTLGLFFNKAYEWISKQLNDAFESQFWKGKNESTRNSIVDFFNTVLTILRFYNNKKLQYKPSSVLKLTINFEKVVDITLIEPSKTCLNMFFKNLSKLMASMDIKSWKNPSNSARQEVGENIYYICKEAVDLPPHVLQKLEAFVVEPDLPEIPTIDIYKIIGHVKDGEKNWFKPLILYKEVEKKPIESDTLSPVSSDLKSDDEESWVNAAPEGLRTFPDFNNSEIVDCLLQNFNFADSDDHCVILKKCVSSLLSDKPEELETKIRKLFLKALNYESPNQNSETFLMNVFRNHGDAIPRLEIELNSSEMERFNEELNLTFNKFCNEESVRPYEVAKLCLQSKEKCLIKICRAAINDSKQIDVCLNIIDDLKGAFECRSRESDRLSLLEHVLLKFIVTEDLSEKDQNLFVLFFLGLVQKTLIDLKVHDEIISILNLKLSEESYEKTMFFLELIKTGLESKSFAKFRCCFLVSMSEILDSLTWNFENFSNVKADGKNLVGSLVSEIIGKWNQTCGMDSWVRENVQLCSEINQAYFCDMWFRFGHHWSGSRSFQTLLLLLIHTVDKINDVTTFLIDLHELEKETRAKDSMVLSLATLLPFLTFPQWDLMFVRLKNVYKNIYAENESFKLDSHVLDIFSSALHLLTLQLNRNEKMSQCYEYCLRNYGRLVKCSVERSKEFKLNILEKTIFFLERIGDAKKKEICSVIVLPVLVDLIESVRTTSDEESTRIKINGLIKVLNVQQVDEAIGKRFAK